MISSDSYPCRSDELAWRVIDGEVVILTIDGSEIHTLNKVGSAIWELADGTRTLEDVVSLICERFEVSFDVAHADVLKFAQQLEAKKMLQITNRDAGANGDGD